MAKPRSPKKQNGVAAATTVQTAPIPTPTVEPASIEAAAEPKMATKKPTIVRTEPRANLVPINVDEEIRRLAYLMSERRGFEPGHEAEDWLAAEHEVRQRYHQQSA